MKRINMGILDTRTGIYTKKIVWNKAVLWKDRQISLPEPVMKNIKSQGIHTIEFVDDTKKKKWVFQVDKVFTTMEWKKVGQEAQFYFPIGLAKEIDLTIKVEPEKPQQLTII